MPAHAPKPRLVRLVPCVASAVLAAPVSGCVSEAVYRDALREAQLARIEATQRDQQNRFQQAQLAWLAEQLEKRSGHGADARATADLARAARDLSGWVQAVTTTPCSGEPSPATDDWPASRPSPRPGGAGTQKPPPLDKADPWSLPRAALGPQGPKGRRDALAAHPLDDEDPWASLRKPLDGDDPWRQ